MKEYFHKCDKKLDNNLRIMQLDFTELFAKVTVSHKSKVAQILDSKYVCHSLDLKPPDEYRSKYEKKK
jgi:hypothetical protein